jgi:hypothetical protein
MGQTKLSQLKRLGFRADMLRHRQRLATPHARGSYDENLMCVIGGSLIDIDYGAPDGKPVSMVVMPLVPENQRNHYLREVSSWPRRWKPTRSTAEIA